MNQAEHPADAPPGQDAARWQDAARLRAEHSGWVIVVRHEVAQCEWTRRLEGRQMPGV
jgi:hypothetical protein